MLKEKALKDLSVYLSQALKMSVFKNLLWLMLEMKIIYRAAK